HAIQSVFRPEDEDRPIEGDGKDEAAVVVSVLTDEVYTPGGSAESKGASGIEVIGKKFF
ncbi:unnamed protein product, partial [marine sediment metagenome]